VQRKLIIILSLITYWVYAQDQDSARVLDDVIIKAYAHDRPMQEVPAAISKISTIDLERFSNTNFLPALNAQPGVRMEERSPGSYRLSIRGSTLRSPFGVRNVKVYWNDLPFTDFGGNTYFNLLDFNSIDNLEIIKGPGSSLYGAGTGGVLLLNKGARNKDVFTTTLQAGSYGMMRGQVGYDESFKKFNISINQAGQQSDGYRDQSAMKRNTESIRSDIKLGKNNVLSVNLIHSNLFYETPGGLTKIQYDTLPTMARPGVEDKEAAIYNQTFFGGLTWAGEFGQWSTRTSIFGNVTDFENPALLNYEKRNERGYGLRTENNWTGKKSRLMVGAEFQAGRSEISVGGNDKGNYVDNGNDVRLPTHIFFVFGQYDLTLPKNFFLTAGLSFNQLTLQFDTLLKVNTYAPVNERNLSSILSPRVALLKKWNTHLSSYLSYSRGYSPPTTAEVFPSLAIYNPNLKPEYGNNYEAGLKGFWSLMELGVTFYSFQLDQTIIKLDSAGSDYFTNSGHTSQNGVELYMKFKSRIGLSGWYSHAFNHYRFKDYVQDANDFSGNKLTGAAPSVISSGIDYRWRGFYTNITANYVDKIPLNDANTAYADSYLLCGLRLGYRTKKGTGPFEFFGGVDNLLDTQYSLGNDLNARGGRYFNAAPGRNFYAGVQMRFSLPKVL
jgi:iron complex outermembrane receptor protein